MDLLDAVRLQVADHALDLQLAHRVLSRDQLGDRKAGLHPDRKPPEIELAISGEEQGGLAKGLRGQRAGVHSRTTRLRLFLDDGDAFTEVGGLCGAFLPGGSRADNDQIEPVDAAWLHRSLPRPPLRRPAPVSRSAKYPGRRVRWARAYARRDAGGRRVRHPGHE